MQWVGWKVHSTTLCGGSNFTSLNLLKFDLCKVLPEIQKPKEGSHLGLGGGLLLLPLICTWYRWDLSHIYNIIYEVYIKKKHCLCGDFRQCQFASKEIWNDLPLAESISSLMFSLAARQSWALQGFDKIYIFVQFYFPSHHTIIFGILNVKTRVVSFNMQIRFWRKYSHVPEIDICCKTGFKFYFVC